MQRAALVFVIAAGLWLASVGALMAVRPGYCLELMARMTAALEKSSWRLNLTEQGLRILAGAALAWRAPASKWPLLFEVTGWVLILSSALILFAPMRWHAAYGRMLLRRLTPAAVRAFAPAPALAGTGLIYLAL